MPKLYALFFAFYGFLWKLFLPFLRRNKRIKDGFAQRQIPDGWLTQDIVFIHDLAFEKNPDKPFFGDQKNSDYTPVDIWIQAASGGEAYLACELIKFLPKDTRSYRILVTTWTRQGMQILTQECEKLLSLFPIESAPFIQIRFAPFDTKEAVNKALLLAKPKVCIMLETELWPCFMLLCKQRKIPFYVVNGRMSKSTFELYKIISPVLNYVAPKQILAMTKNDMDRFFQVFSSSLISFMPNIKFDTARELVNKKYAHLLEKVSNELPNELSNELLSELPNNLAAKCSNKVLDEQSQNLVKETREKASAHTDDKSIFDNSLPEKKDGSIEVQTENAHRKKIFSQKTQDDKEQCLAEMEESSLLEKKTYLLALPLLFSKVQKTFLFASIRQEEENFFASLLWKIYPKRKNDIFIIAPRHMHRVKYWRRRFYDLGMKFALASEVLQDKDFSENIDFAFDPAMCIIWDIFGDLPHLYAQTDMAIVGGSFKNLGGQNFLEAIASGVKAHVGTHIDNFLWALGEENYHSMHDFTKTSLKDMTSKKDVTKNEAQIIYQSLVDTGLLQMHKNKKSLENAILAENKCKKTSYERLEIQKQLRIWLENRCGGSAIALECILQTERL